MKALLRSSWLAVGFVCYCEIAHAEVQIDDTPPDYLGIDQREERIRLSEHRGRVVMTTFWASWCGPCLNEMPILEKVQKAGAAIAW